jgi:PKD repeat protein
MKSCTTGATGILVFILAVFLLVSPASAWLAGYGYEKNISFNTTGWSSNVTNPQISLNVFRSTGTDSGLNLYLGTGIQEDFDDIRFTDNSDNLLPYWVQSISGNSSEIVWVKIPSLNTTATPSIKVYYNNATATSVSSNTTFYDFDDFNGASLNGTKWSSGGTVSVSNSICTLSGASSASYITYNTNLGSGYFYIVNTTRTVYGTIHNVGSDFGLSDVSFQFNSRGRTGYSEYNGYYRNGIDSYPNADGAGTSGYVINVFKLENNTVKFSVDGSNTYNSVYWAGGTAALKIASASGSYASGTYDYTGYVAIGKCGISEPTLSYGSEQLPGSTLFTANATVVAPGANVSFTDQSTGSPTAWWWDTNGDGVIDNTTQNCTRAYATPGLYTVVLTSQASGINSTLTKSDYISVGQAPLATFITNKTSGTNPVNVQFNDTSIRSPTMFNWSWGEGGSNTTTQNASHAFTSSGSFVVIFTAANAYGSSSNSTTITVQSSNNASGYGQYYAAQTVTFHVQSPFGAPIAGATVTMQGTATSSGSWDWLGQLLGIRFNETPINTQVMTATTDSNGDAQFFVFPTTIYSVHILKAGVVDKTITVTPTDAKYVIPVDWQVFGDTGSVLAAVSFNVTTSDYSATQKRITVTGTDTLGHFTGGVVNLNQTVNGTETNLQAWNIPANNFTTDFIVTNYKGQSYLVRINATQSDYGNIIRDYGVAFPKDKVNPMGLDDKLLMLISMGILILFGAIFTSTTAHNGALLTCFIGWILYGLGWMDYGGTTIPLALTFATVISLAVIILVGRDKS